MKTLLFFLFLMVVHAIRYNVVIDYTAKENITEVTKIYDLDVPFNNLYLEVE